MWVVSLSVCCVRCWGWRNRVLYLERFHRYCARLWKATAPRHFFTWHLYAVG
jgi:hypothetical protein